MAGFTGIDGEFGLRYKLRMQIDDRHFSFLGREVRDKVTGFKGIATTLSFDLYGCVQTIVQPPVDSDGKTPESRWFDNNRLDVVTGESVMRVPNYAVDVRERDESGPSDKPAFASNPLR